MYTKKAKQKPPELILNVINKNLKFIHWCLNWSTDETGRNLLVLVRPKTAGDQSIKILYEKKNPIPYQI